MRFLLYTLFCLNYLLSFTNVHALENPKHSNSQIPENVTIPAPFELENGVWLPAVNQFVITPGLGELTVQYVGIFNNFNLKNEPSEAIMVPSMVEKTKKFILPFPKGVSDQTEYIDVKLTDGVQQIHKTFTLNAPLGTFNWKAGHLQTLPGVTVIVLNDVSAKITMRSENFIHDFSEKSEGGQQYVRVTWDKNIQYPAFDLTNLIPSRIFAFIWIILSGVFVFSILWIFVRIKKA